MFREFWIAPLVAFITAALGLWPAPAGGGSAAQLDRAANADRIDTAASAPEGMTLSSTGHSWCGLRSQARFAAPRATRPRT